MSTRRTVVIASLLVILIPVAAAAAGPEILPLDPGAPAARSDVTVLDRHPAGLTLEFTLTGLEQDRLTAGSVEFTELAIPDGGFRGAEGQAALPTITRLVAVPDGLGAQIRIIDRDQRSLGAMSLAPVQPIVDQGKAAPAVDAAWYASAPVSEPTVSVGEPAFLHGLRVVPVTFAPVGFDPATGEVTAARRITVELTFAGVDDRAAATAGPRLIPESFATLYERSIVGWERDDNVQVGPGSAIYVCPDISTVTSIVEDLAQWRREQGYNVLVVTTGITGPTNNQIRSWLLNQYATIDPPLEFVTLVGDANGAIAVPTFNETSSGYYGEGDHNYSRLDGEDVLPDVHVGRISVQSTSQLQIAVDKILAYERTPDLSDTDWFTTAGLTGDPSTSGYSCIFTNQFIKQELLRLGYTQVDTIWGNPFLTRMMATVNQGETVFTYRGLAGMSGMNYSHILALSNGQRLPFAAILTCDTGSFQDDATARSEAWLRASNGGGIASIGTATIGTHTRYNNCMFLGIFDQLLDGVDARFGPALTSGKLNFYTNYWQNEANKVWTWMTWNNLMGDPATEMWTGIPHLLSVDYPATVAATASLLPVTVADHGSPVAGARVAVYQAGTVRSYAVTNAAGEALVDIADAAMGDMHVTVTGRNLAPHRGLATVGTVAQSLDLVAVSVNDAAGNGDGAVNPGETLQVTAQLINGGTATATGVNAALVAGPDWTDFTGSPVYVGDLAAGASAWAEDPFSITIAPHAPAGSNAVFEMIATSGADNWPSRLAVTVFGARSEVYVASWGLPGNSPDPGEAGDLTLVLRNVGNLATSGATARLSTGSRWVTVTDGVGAYGPGTVGGNLAPTNVFSVSIDPLCMPGHLAGFVLELTFAEGGTQVLEFPAVIGTVAPGDPSGPDPYGYWAFSNDDTHELAPTYDWVDLVDIGQNTGIDDNGRWDDETKVVDLPFPFAYYGEIYDRVSICSNGWLAFGVTDLKFYRNWMLPANGSPDAMVAAFWDDLADGDIYTWHDVANHRFVVQWDDFGTWYESSENHSGNCTFQIILTDPAHSGTDTGDGLITLQYQSVTISPDETTYFTTGIQDRTRTVGLTYAFGNNYAGGAAAINGGRAIAFRPVMSGEPGTLTGSVTVGEGDPQPVPGAVVDVLESLHAYASDSDGDFSGILSEGTWDLAVSHPSCDPDTVYGVVVQAGQATAADFTLVDTGGPAFAGTTRLSATDDTVGPYAVESTLTDLTGLADYHLYCTSSADGEPFEVPLVLVDAEAGLVRGEIPGQPTGSRIRYWLTASDVLGNVSAEPAGAPWPSFSFQVGGTVSDVVDEDFENGVGGWQYNLGGGDTASSGIWLLANPVGSESDGQPVQPEDDHTPAPGVTCWVTGQHIAGQSAGYNDVDGGTTTLVSPVWDLSSHGAVTVSYWRWYTNDLGGSPGEDVWVVQVSNDGGGSWQNVESTTASNNAWQPVTFQLDEHFETPDQVRLRFSASDNGGGSLVEAAVDDLTIQATALLPDLDAPTVTVTSPDGGEIYSTGQIMTIGWAAGDDIGVVETRISLSLDGGQNWGDPILAGPLAGTAQWTVDVPGGGSQQARIRVEVLDGEGRSAVDVSDADFTITVDPLDAPPAAVLDLAQNHPNPFNPATVIAFSLPRSQNVSLNIYDVQGRLVRALLHGEQTAGRHEVLWQGRDESGNGVASGTYFYRLVADEGTLVRKMMLLK